MLRFNQLQDQFNGMEKSFFYEYEDLYEDAEKNEKENRKDKKTQRPQSPYFI